MMPQHGRVAQQARVRAQGLLHRARGRVLTDHHAGPQLELHGVAVQRI